jgi:peptidyl-prolyl cis-trans isomerase SurA
VLLDRIAAVVNQEVITWSELYRNMESDASPQLKAMTEDERKKIFKENEAVFLETLINSRLQLQEAKNMGITVTDDELNETIEGIKKKYSMSDAEFKESLKKEGFTFEEYRKRLSEQIILGKVVNQQVRSKILVPEGEMQKYIDASRGGADNPEGYRISQIWLKMPKSEEGKKLAEEKAADILARLKNGESFAEIARAQSEDPSAGAGGDLGFVRKGHLMKEFSEVIATMKPGDVSRPFWTESGLHIIKLNEKAAARSESELREEAKKEISDRMFKEKYNAWIKVLREKAFIEIRL